MPAVNIICTLLIIGLLAGMLSGLVGVGGGIILVPCLVYFMHYSQHQAQGTSLGVLMFPVVALAFMYYYKSLQGTPHPIDFWVIGILAIGFVIGGMIGSNIALKIDQVLLKRIFGIALLYICFKMLQWDMRIFIAALCYVIVQALGWDEQVMRYIKGK